MSVQLKYAPNDSLVKVVGIHPSSYWKEAPHLILGLIGRNHYGHQIVVPGGVKLPETASSNLRDNVDGDFVELNSHTLVEVLEDPDGNY